MNKLKLGDLTFHFSKLFLNIESEFFKKDEMQLSSLIISFNIINNH